MIRLIGHNGQEYLLPETEEERLSMLPEAKLRALLAGDEAATLRFHDRMRDLDRRFDLWEYESWARNQGAVAFRLPQRMPA